MSTRTGESPSTPRNPRPGPRPRVLVLRALGLGDLLAAVPALRALRRGLPGHDIVLAAPARLTTAAAATGLVDRLLPASAPGRAVPAELAWDGPPPDLAVDLHGNGPASRGLLAALRPRALYAYGRPDGPVWRDDEHERERWCRLLAAHGLPSDPEDLSVPPPATRSPAPGAVVVHPGADAAARRWPMERFAAVARELHREGHRVVVTAGAAEARPAASVAGRAGLPEGAVFGGAGGDIPFDVLMALVAEARCVVVGDTGLAHLATALGTPSVTLFGPVAPRLWGPPVRPHHRVLWHPDADDPPRPGDAHGDRPDERLLRITVAEVLDAVRTLPLPGPGPGPRSGQAAVLRPG
ncbi:glycosyltransferase family 9 protein [Streptomyces pristinaespiralis]|uniref:Glycosyl transferase n=1 Tax=Streptomyces pristinaespiralis TaxID=38300 RepID=A0A0M4D988_STRPR|nr:glycosyltransferase family 9 protein [Streptomyces pristinaespiralis]ALC20188.1 glycosyl transferase [Streptomyces pristinaespiralis]QMU16922.1 glycosyltransferase family 9 protein [Streptomyces pristinaespiralis]